MKLFQCPRCRRFVPFTEEVDAGQGKHANLRSPEVRCKCTLLGIVLQRSHDDMNFLRMQALSKYDIWRHVIDLIKERALSESKP